MINANYSFSATLFFTKIFWLILKCVYTFQKNPLMARIETKAGHGQGKPTSKLIEEVSEVFSFIAKALKYEFIE